ncbi:MAG: hypothetical protein Q4C60_08725 [Eubacteriales bacterium]|nr:hypothetical protein [Eubacteriales bacterium]
MRTRKQAAIQKRYRTEECGILLSQPQILSQGWRHAAQMEVSSNFEPCQTHFNAARDKIITLGGWERHGIGMQKEKTLHAVVKQYEDPDEDHHEIPVEGYIADIFTGTQIIEIQNGNFNKMRGKLAAFLPLYPVRIVYPMPYEKWIYWINPETGELNKKNKCAGRGNFYQAFRELYRIRPFLSHPNLSIELLLIDMEEYRLQDGWDRSGKRGSHRYDRIPLTLRDSLLLTCPQDYRLFVPYDLPEPFTCADFGRAAGIRGSFSAILLMLTELGVVARVGKRGNAYLYRCVESWDGETWAGDDRSMFWQPEE